MSGRTPDEGRYSKVSRRMWDDERFGELSAAKPNGQTLWQRLLTGPELGCVPGLFAAREGGLADALRWPVAALRKCWKEIEDSQMAEADWRAGLVWVPNGIVHNAPQSTNVILGWRLALRELPECSLKHRALQGIREYLAEMGPVWVKAFDSAMAEPTAKPKDKASLMPKAMALAKASAMPSDTPSRIQEQEQDSGERKNTQGGSQDLTSNAHEASRQPEPARTPNNPNPDQISSARRAALAFERPDPADLKVLEAWRDRFKKTDVVFTAERAMYIAERRREGMTHQDAIDALEGAAEDDWFMRQGAKASLVFNKRERFEGYRDAGRAARTGVATSPRGPGLASVTPAPRPERWVDPDAANRDKFAPPPDDLPASLGEP